MLSSFLSQACSPASTFALLSLILTAATTCKKNRQKTGRCSVIGRYIYIYIYIEREKHCSYITTKIGNKEECQEQDQSQVLSRICEEEVGAQEQSSPGPGQGHPG